MDKSTHRIDTIVPHLSFIPDRISDEWKLSPSLAAAKRLCSTRYAFAPDGKTKHYVEFQLFEWKNDKWTLLYSSPDNATVLPWEK